ncbi:MAG: bifunctional pyr operon transcriptional regulator/uracil phosphoribosyltransferase PyrR [Gemmatimonadota bacterium]
MQTGSESRGERGGDADERGRVLLMDGEDVEARLEALAGEILEAGGHEDLVLVGIRRRGVQLATRLARLVEERTGREVPTGSLDITLYRDDFAQIGPRPLIGSTELPPDISDRRVVIVDDVLYTGRTVRAALDEIADFGRPRRIELCVLVDRGGRELPIQPDYVGRSVTVDEGRQVAVSVPEIDGELAVHTVPEDAAE